MASVGRSKGDSSAYRRVWRHGRDGRVQVAAARSVHPDRRELDSCQRRCSGTASSPIGHTSRDDNDPAQSSPLAPWLVILGSTRTADRNCQSGAHGPHADVSQSAKAVHKHRDRHTFDRVQIDRRAPWHRVIARLENDLAGKTSDRRRAGSDQYTSKPRYRGVAGQDDDRPPTDLGELAPPHFSSHRQRAHDAAAARRNDARSPHSSGSSIGCCS